jgi:hypothetical protein
MRLIAVITDPWSGYRTEPPEVRTTLRHPKGGALRRLVKIGRAPPGLDPCVLN